MAFGATVAIQGAPDGGSVEQQVELAGAGIGLSLLVVPVAFLAAAWVSRKEDWPLWTAAAMGLSLLVGLPLMAFGDPLAALLSGFAAGAVVALSRPEGTSWRPRAVAAAVVAVLALLGGRSVFIVFALVGPALPFTAMGLVDLSRFGRAPDAPLA